MRRLAAPGLAVGLALGLVSPVAADETVAVGPPLFEQVCKTVQRSFYDRTFGGRDLAAWRAAWLPAAQAAPSERRLRAVINGMLGEFKVSHFSLLEPEVYRAHFLPELQNAPAPQLGIEWVRLPAGFFVAGVWEGGPAERAGLRRGDRLLAVDGIPPERHPHLLPGGSDPGLPSPPGYFLVPGAPGDEVHLRVERRPGEPVETWVDPEPLTMVEAGRRSIRVLTAGTARVGVMHFWHFLRPEVVADFRRALEGPFADCDALLLDVRGRGGSPVVVDQLLAAVRRARGAAPWGEACAVLIDEGSRSAKEIFAWRYRKEALGPLIGRRTEGAVIASTFFPMADGSVLLMGIREVSAMSGGQSLEGVGVAPDIDVPGELPYAAGRDEILERALAWAAEAVAAKSKRGRPMALPAPRRRAA